VHHRPGFSCDVRTWSARTFNSECVNGENTLGAHLADGAAYTMVRGDEYADIFAVWDWQRLPGVLARQQHPVDTPCSFESLGATVFVGGLEVASLNLTVAAMDFSHGPRPGAATLDCRSGDCRGANVRTGVAAPLTAKRAWFMLDRGFVSLTANVSLADADESVAVGIEQSLLAGEVTSMRWERASGVTPAKPVATGNSSFDLGAPTDGVWVSHRNITYVALSGFLPPSSTSSLPSSTVSPTAPTLKVSVGQQRGSWHAISSERSAEPVVKAVFKLWLDLGPAPMAGMSAGYAVFPGATPAAVASALGRINVVANNAERQVVLEQRPGGGTDGHPWRRQGPQLLMAVVYTSGVIISAAEAGFDLSTDGALLLSLADDGNGSLTFSFSRPVGGSGVVRLEATGLPGFLTTASSAGRPDRSAPAVACKSAGANRTTIDLTFPAATGRSASGKCRYII